MTDLAKQISEATAKHCAALFFSKFLDVIFKGTADSIDAQGTMTFIKYRERCFGVTNQHVLTDYERPSTDKVFHLALRRHIPLPGRLLFKSTKDNQDFPFDIAVFLLDEKRVTDGGKTPIDLATEFKPLKEDEQGLAVGFPGIERHVNDPLRMAHPLYHVVAKCVGASDRQIVLQDEARPPENRIVRFGGMSGGPIFRLNGNESYAFTGILFEGRGFSDTVDGIAGTEIWVYGFPLGPNLFHQALSLFKPDLDL